MTSLAEEVQIKNTRKFIEESPSEIVLNRWDKQPTPDGGFKRVKEPYPLTPQTGRIVHAARLSATTTYVDEDGKKIIIIGTLVMEPGADIQTGDTFEVDEEHWQVANVLRVPSWRVSAEVGKRV